ncbi:hypothetical protein A2960_05160 [Candidatus Gottesmanbacteria bacterium RIFCSPLOWO2_01_FULL_39_12b]|uniref:Uncharacterized protein n=1 Tax=Candidatus Gottesmanbacteria bacterium RIFCSPLOWO2_01_FULL_39_12b TaxID=1798388 RepID=A0A1F6AM00_9BACT|nr:MAG: hypothetical protein A2960_05160 [Candidatus Gottesmanbacteria bacterium RIFCSPLOWO2_01_FULL_39_12b]
MNPTPTNIHIGLSISEPKVTTPVPEDGELDKLARNWIELVLSQIQKQPVVKLQNTSYNIYKEDYEDRR